MTNIASAINKIFWGLLFVLIDINIIFIDIFPDFIGYFMIVSGVSHVETFSAFFSKAKVLALLLGIASIPLLFKFEINLLEGFKPSGFSLSVLLVSAILGLLHLALIYYVIHGFIELAEKHDIVTFPAVAQKRLSIYVMMILTTTTAAPFVINVTDTTAFFILAICGIISLIMEISILVLIRSLRNQFLYRDSTEYIIKSAALNHKNP